MSADPWSRLAAPFPAAAVAWQLVDASADRTRLRLVPHLPAAALRDRLNAVLEPSGWSLRLSAWGHDGLIAELVIAGATRAAAVRSPVAPGRPRPSAAADPDSGDELADVAFAAAAAAFGMRTSVVRADDGWVDADPEAGEPLYLPATQGRDVDPARAGDAGILLPEDEAGASTDASDTAEPTGAAAPARGGDSGAPAEAPSGAPAAKPEAQRVIDRLVDRLREEGHGAEAAKLVLSYGGYGGDPERSRELYTRLRSLLIERSRPT